MCFSLCIYCMWVHEWVIRWILHESIYCIRSLRWRTCFWGFFTFPDIIIPDRIKSEMEIISTWACIYNYIESLYNYIFNTRTIATRSSYLIHVNSFRIVFEAPFVFLQIALLPGWVKCHNMLYIEVFYVHVANICTRQTCCTFRNRPCSRLHPYNIPQAINKIKWSFSCSGHEESGQVVSTNFFSRKCVTVGVYLWQHTDKQHCWQKWWRD